MGFDTEARTKAVTLLSETMEKYSVLRLGPNCLESFSDYFSFSGKQQTGTSW